MDALRRLFGGGGGRPGGAAGDAGEEAATPATAEEIDAEERARELELLRAEQDRLDELVLRQQRYADRSWVPPSQGGPRRSDDGEAAASEDR
ncbi:MAG TPA: hypothetical protein VFY18_05730 [Candidatus Limnocylindrales bacterium]|nr:hypothetical protein [Candidatus Limnocylindrales bacterium]